MTTRSNAKKGKKESAPKFKNKHSYIFCTNTISADRFFDNQGKLLVELVNVVNYPWNHPYRITVEYIKPKKGTSK